MSLFEKRLNLKPYEYPELLQYKDAIQHSYWLFSEFNLTQDVQDYHTKTSNSEREAITRTMLAIAQIENSVKTFWARLYDKMPKPEIAMVGYVFAESEVRHAEAYSSLLEVLGLNREFEKINSIPAIKDRVAYLQGYLAGASSRSNQDYMMSLLLFSIFTEHVSLFSQFLIMLAYNKHRNTFKGIANIVQATCHEENVHGMFGMQLIQILKQENPEWFGSDFEAMVVKACKKAQRAEHKVLDWIFECGELEFLPKRTIRAFIDDRFNKSLRAVGLNDIFEVDAEQLSAVAWFDEELLSGIHTDFFDKRPNTYSKFQQAVTADDLF